MIYPPELLDLLQDLTSTSWAGEVFRHMFADYPPERRNTRGARWNPPQTAAIYCSLERETALAEAEHQLNLQPIRPRAKRTLYKIRIRLDSVLDLRSPSLLVRLGVTSDRLGDVDFSACQRVGGAVAWLGHDGLLVPSARLSGGSNMVLYPTLEDLDADFQVIDAEMVSDRE